MAFNFNPITAYKNNIRTTRMPIKGNAPKNTREAICVDETYEDGIFRIERGSGLCVYDRCYVFSDINYANCDDDEEKNILENLVRVLNFMNSDFKITVANEYRDMQRYVMGLYADLNAEEYPYFSRGIREWIKERFRSVDIHNLEKVLYLTITVRTDSYENARSYFLHMDMQLVNLFQSLHSVIVPLNGVQRAQMLRRFIYRRDDLIPMYEDGAGKDILTEAIPTSIDAGYKSFMIFNNRLYISVLFARGIGAKIKPSEAIHTLQNVSYPGFVTIDYAPVEDSLFQDMLDRVSLNNERAISNEQETRRKSGQMALGISYSKQRIKDELEEYMDQFIDNNDTNLLAGILLVVTADSEGELARRVDSAIAAAKDVKITLETYDYVQLKAFNTALPIGCRLVKHMRSYMSSSVVGFQPFYAQDLNEKGGMFLGINRTTHQPILANRKKLKSPHGIIVGHTGSGKSFYIKETDVAQTLLCTNDDLFIIDPQNEFESICELSNGQFIDLTPKSTVHINPMEVSAEVFEEGRSSEGVKERFVSDIITWATSFCASIMQNVLFTSDHRALLGNCIREIYDEVFSRRKLIQPTLRDLRDKVKEKEEQLKNFNDKDMLHRVFNALSEYTDGSYDMFAYESNVDFKKRFVAFGMYNVASENWEPVMITIMFYLSNRMENNQGLQRATHLIVDETQVVTEHSSSAEILLRAVRTFRKFGGIVTMALQNLTSALENPELRDVFSNCGYKCFFDSGGVDAQSLSLVQDLSSREMTALNEDFPGRGVMVWGKKVIMFDAYMDRGNSLYAEFSTNFHEKAQSRREEDNMPLQGQSETDEESGGGNPGSGRHRGRHSQKVG